MTLRPDGPPPITGVVDVATSEFLGVRSAAGYTGSARRATPGCGVSAYHYFYGDPVDTEALTVAWQGWLAELFPAPEPAPS